MWRTNINLTVCVYMRCLLIEEIRELVLLLCYKLITLSKKDATNDGGEKIYFRVRGHQSQKL